MITREEAKKLVVGYLEDRWPKLRRRVVVIDESTIEKPYGWVLFYNTREYLETRKVRYSVIGNGPVVVEKCDGSVHELGSGGSTEYQLSAYEKRRATPKAGDGAC